ncbi:thiolase family protein [Nocardioides luteus]|uniref:DitF protein n=1 Tax=Nocardioides luteus TaxID=1844 RepID=A0A1J4N577_9ACTN|nr:thiolase family protein [Nocardioides luteus]OIJ26709.1 DitF protein [Nocardioides luteus]
MSHHTRDHVAIVGAGESPYTRHPAAGTTTAGVLGDAVIRALRDAGLEPGDVDGLGFASFTLGPDHAIDLAWRLGLHLRWIMQDTNGGASAGGMLQHAVRAVEAGDASVIVLVAGDAMDNAAHERLVKAYNQATVDHLAGLPMTGPNALFAMLTQRQMAAWQLDRKDYGSLVTAQRAWAGLNPGAVYRAPMTIDEYLDAPLVAAPLGRFDCVPPVTGADAIVVTAEERATGRRARVLAVTAAYNGDDQVGDGIRTAVAACAPAAWERAGVAPTDTDVISVYDDYPAMVLSQLVDLGVTDPGSVQAVVAEQIATRRLPVNTSGGQLSAGQAGAGGGMHGMVEVVQQLRGRASGRQVEARIGVVTGYGMVLYRHGSCGNVAVLEAVA